MITDSPNFPSAYLRAVFGRGEMSTYIKKKLDEATDALVAEGFTEYEIADAYHAFVDQLQNNVREFNK